MRILSSGLKLSGIIRVRSRPLYRRIRIVCALSDPVRLTIAQSGASDAPVRLSGMTAYPDDVRMATSDVNGRIRSLCDPYQIQRKQSCIQRASSRAYRMRNSHDKLHDTDALRNPPPRRHPDARAQAQPKPHDALRSSAANPVRIAHKSTSVIHCRNNRTGCAHACAYPRRTLTRARARRAAYPTAVLTIRNHPRACP